MSPAKKANESSKNISLDNSAIKPNRICQFCATTAPTIFVHGHEQCSNCGKNVEECCQGSECVL